MDQQETSDIYTENIRAHPEVRIRSSKVKQVLIFVVGLLVLDQIFGSSMLFIAPETWKIFFSAKKQLQVGETYKYFVIGDSYAFAGFDPRVAEQMARGPSFNYGILALDIRALTLHIDDLRELIQPPKYFVIYLNHEILTKSARPLELSYSVLHNPLIRLVGIFSLLSNDTVVSLSLVGRRRDIVWGFLRTALKRSLRGETDRDQSPSEIYHGYALFDSKSSAANINLTYVHGNVRSENLELLRTAIKNIKTWGAIPIVACPPVHPRLYEALQWRDDFAKFKSDLSSLLREEKVNYFSCFDDSYFISFPTDSFHDATHLNARGASRYTRDLVAWVTDLSDRLNF